MKRECFMQGLVRSVRRGNEMHILVPLDTQFQSTAVAKQFQDVQCKLPIRAEISVCDVAGRNALFTVPTAYVLLNERSDVMMVVVYVDTALYSALMNGLERERLMQLLDQVWSCTLMRYLLLDCTFPYTVRITNKTIAEAKAEPETSQMKRLFGGLLTIGGFLIIAYSLLQYGSSLWDYLKSWMPSGSKSSTSTPSDPKSSKWLPSFLQFSSSSPPPPPPPPRSIAENRAIVVQKVSHLKIEKEVGKEGEGYVNPSVLQSGAAFAKTETGQMAICHVDRSCNTENVQCHAAQMEPLVDWMRNSAATFVHNASQLPESHPSKQKALASAHNVLDRLAEFSASQNDITKQAWLLNSAAESIAAMETIVQDPTVGVNLGEPLTQDQLDAVLHIASSSPFSTTFSPLSKSIQTISSNLSNISLILNAAQVIASIFVPGAVQYIAAAGMVTNQLKGS